MHSDHHDNVARLRESINTIRTEMAELEDGNIPKVEALAKLDAWLDINMANRWPFKIPAYQFTQNGSTAHTIQGLDDFVLSGLLVEILKPQIREHFARQVEAQYAGKTKTVSAEQRTNRLQELRTELRAIELEEEEEITRAELAGFDIARRADVRADVLAQVLG